jgi:hypothetical protein
MLFHRTSTPVVPELLTDLHQELKLQKYVFLVLQKIGLLCGGVVQVCMLTWQEVAKTCEPSY